MLSFSQISSPALGRMFMAHPHRWALAFLGSGFGGSFRARQNRNRCGGITYKFCARVEKMSSVAD